MFILCGNWIFYSQFSFIVDGNDYFPHNSLGWINSNLFKFAASIEGSQTENRTGNRKESINWFKVKNQMDYNNLLSIISDVGLLTLNRYILLDPILLCFMMCATWGMARVGSLQNVPFTKSWWGWLIFTGASLACTISVKFVGLFVVLLVGIFTIHELWRELGDLSKPVVGKTIVSDWIISRECA